MKKSLLLGLIFCLSLMVSFSSFAQDENFSVNSCEDLQSELCTTSDLPCTWDEENNICLNSGDIAGPLWDFNRCRFYRGPRECNYSRECRWDPRRGCVERGGHPFPMPPIHHNRCNMIRNPLRCNFTPGCHWDRYRFRCERQGMWPN